MQKAFWPKIFFLSLGISSFLLCPEGGFQLQHIWNPDSRQKFLYIYNMQNNKKKRNFLNVVRKKTKMWPVNILKTEKRKVYFAYCKYPEKKGEKSMKKNIRLSEIDAKMEELCHQMYDAWNEGDIDTHIALLKQMQELAEEGKRIRKDNGEKDESIAEWVEL